MIDKNLLSKFSREIQNDFVIYKYKNKKNRNLWNCICSCNDWLNVAVDYILNSSDFSDSIQMYSYICCIDIIVESIEQLHRVFFERENHPFSNEVDCFGRMLEMNDKEYFKEIRACFGAHPVNLEKLPIDDKKERRFSSWSIYDEPEKPLSITLYSNNPDKQDYFMDINIGELNKYVEKYYNYLNNIVEKIEKDFKKFCESFPAIPLNNDPLTQLRILKQNSLERLNWYSDEINELLIIFETPIKNSDNKKLVEKFKKSLLPLVKEIYENLLYMRYDDLKNDILSKLYMTDLNLGNSLEKLHDYIVLDKNYPINICVKKIHREMSGYFNFEYDSYKELYILILASLLRINCKN